MPRDRRESPRAPAAGAPPAVRLHVDEAARTALRAALAGRAKGVGVRLWVERGVHPHAQMMIDRPSPRDLPVEIEGLALFVDESSTRFLLDAEVRYRTDQEPPGFEVVGPFLPSATAPPSPGAAPAAVEGIPEAEAAVRNALKNIYDPEIPMNIVDLGLIYGLTRDEHGGLRIRMTMTSPGCPAVEQLVAEVERAARDASGAPTVSVEIVWEPPWGPERMTEFARRQFGYA